MEPDGPGEPRSVRVGVALALSHGAAGVAGRVSNDRNLSGMQAAS